MQEYSYNFFVLFFQEQVETRETSSSIRYGSIQKAIKLFETRKLMKGLEKLFTSKEAHKVLLRFITRKIRHEIKLLSSVSKQNLTC